MSDWVTVAREGEIEPGDWRVVDVDGVSIAVFHVDGGYHAIEDVCTHDGECLTGGEVSGTEIVCPRHGAKFSLLSGEALTPPAFEPVPVFPVRVHEGQVQVRDPRLD